MTFAAVTKNIKSMYSNSDFERLFIRYKAEAMPRKSMVQEYKTSNRTGTGLKERRMRNPICKNDDRHPYDKRNTDTATKLNLPELEKSDRETGRTMLNVTGMNRFYYLRNFHDMRCKYEQVLPIIHQQLYREPQEDEVFIGISKLYLFSYLSDGRYDIDNSIAERFIRPLAGERKNSLFFVGSRMANVSAAYHTLLSTCRMNGLSALEYLKKFFHEIVKGRKDYENLLPMTIGINTNKY